MGTGSVLGVWGVLLVASAMRDAFKLHRAGLLQCDSNAATFFQVALGSLSLSASSLLNAVSSVLPEHYVLFAGQKSASLFVASMVLN